MYSRAGRPAAVAGATLVIGSGRPATTRAERARSPRACSGVRVSTGGRGLSSSSLSRTCVSRSSVSPSRTTGCPAMRLLTAGGSARSPRRTTASMRSRTPVGCALMGRDPTPARAAAVVLCPARVADVEGHQAGADVVVGVVEPADVRVEVAAGVDLATEDALRLPRRAVLLHEVVMQREEDLRLDRLEIVDRVAHAVGRVVEAEDRAGLDVGRRELGEDLRQVRRLLAHRAGGVVPGQREAADAELVEQAAALIAGAGGGQDALAGRVHEHKARVGEWRRDEARVGRVLGV